MLCLMLALVGCGASDEDSAGTLDSATGTSTDTLYDTQDTGSPSTQDTDTDGTTDTDDTDPGQDTDDTDTDTEPEPVGPRSFTLGPEDSLVYVQVYKDPSAWGSDLAHDHVIRASDWTGTLSLEDGACSLSITLQVNGLVADEADMRSLVGYGDTISTGDRAEITDNMLSSDQLDASRYSTMSFVTTSCTDTGSQLEVRGDLSIRGRTKTLRLDVPYTVTGDVLEASGTFQTTHSDFGMDTFSAYWGLVANDEPLDFSFDLVAQED